SSSTTYRGQQGYLGINYQPTTSGDALVKGVLWASPAERAGIMEGDCLIAIDGSRINAFSPDQSLVAGKAVGQAVTVTFERGGQ
ncbi:PDZ domain-containing protein, partial [Streptomyces niveiscabiei]|uniref:PDZ domain-containing protein n=1 Tax=Streptomyces niveiscabiei TaxID=164115 RepID=UPI0038F65FCE